MHTQHDEPPHSLVFVFTPSAAFLGIYDHQKFCCGLSHLVVGKEEKEGTYKAEEAK